jgi:cysteine synthase A
VVRINRLAPSHVDVYVKLEAANPGGSVKDRLALASSKTPSAAAP